MNNLMKYGAQQVSTPTDLNTEMPPAQNFAFGGIANPTQRAFLNTADKSYLEARQAELDKFEQERQAYNTALADWQTNVYNPYKTKVEEYNTAADKYNTEVYNPYKAQVDAYNEALNKYNTEVYNPYAAKYAEYEKAVNAWNAGDRTSDYAGPAAPTLSKTFDMGVPTEPQAFGGVIPTAPEDFKGVAPVLPFKEEDVIQYQQQAADRAKQAASGRAVAIDVVSNPDQFNFGSMSIANRFMAKGGPVNANEDYARTAGSIIKDFESYGYTPEEMTKLADEVAAAGRGGDELLAYLSPESVAFLKAHGGAGTINPITGLPEFKGNIIGSIVEAVKSVFGGGSSTPAPTPAPAAPAGPTAAELQAQLDAAAAKYAADLKAQQEAAAKAQEKAISDALAKQYSAVAAPVMGTSQPGYAAAEMLKGIAATGQNPVTTTTGEFWSPDSFFSKKETPAAKPEPMIQAQQALADKAAAGGSSARVTGSTPGKVELSTPAAAYLQSISAAAPLAPVDLGGNLSSTATSNAVRMRQTAPTSTFAQQDQQPIRSQGPATNVPMYDYSSQGIGTAASNLAMPNMSAFGPVGMAQQRTQATNPSNYFAMSQPSQPGISAGTTAIGSPDMPMFGAMNTMNTLGQNKNLSPGMIGGIQNAGVMMDRLGNRIYAPGMAPLLYAKGGDVSMKDILAMNTETLSDEKPEETINTNPVGTAQQYLSDLSNLSPNQISAQAHMGPISLPKGRGSARPKSSGMAELDALLKGDLGAMQDLAPKAKDTDSAKAQMQELARQYKLKIAAAEDKARGFGASTFGAPTLEQPRLTKSSLAKKRFEKGGEAKKAGAESVEEPSIFGVTDYATKASARMYPDQMGQDDERDAVRHMLAAATMSKKYGPSVAEFMGKVHERTSNPESFFSMFGIGKPREDYEMDLHNNRIGAQLGARATSQAELEKLVQAMARESRTKQTEGKPWIMSREQMANRKGQVTTPPPQYAKGGIVEDIGKWLKDNNVNPADFLAALGRTGSAVGAALTPGELNKGEDAELARRRKMEPTVDRADGSPEEGEISQEELDAASRPAFVTPKSGKGRKEGPISKQLKSGEAYVNMAKGMTELPYDLAGAPVDIATLLMRPFGYSTEKPVLSSDWIKEQMTGSKSYQVRPEPPTDSTSKGFYTAGELLSNLTNPAAVSRKVGPVVEKGVKAGAAEVGRQLDRAILDNAGPLAKAVPQAAKPLYISRSPGGYFPTSRTEGGILSNLDKVFDPVLKQIREIDDPEQRKALTVLFNQKAKDFYTKQAGSIQDPLRADILSGALKFDDDSRLADAFPRILQKSVAQGDLQALRLLEKNYDRMIGIRSVVPRIKGTEGVQGVPEAQIMANIQANLDKIPDSQLLAYAGKKPKQGPAGVAEAAAEVREKLKNNPTLFSTVLEPRIARTVFAQSAYTTDSDLARYPSLHGTPATEAMVSNPGGRTPEYYEAVPPGYFLPELETAINKGQPIQDLDRTSIRLLGMSTEKLLNEARQIPVEELNQMGFTDFLKRAYANSQQVDKFEAAIPKVKKLIQDGKVPPADIMTYGIKDYVPSSDNFRWVKVTKPDGVRAIAAGMNNSVASYATSSTYGSLNKGRAALEGGEAEIYSLYDKNNVPHVTVEYLTSKSGVPDAKKNTIAQLTGNGPMTANAIPENYAPQIVDLLNNLRPSSMPTSIKRLLEKTGQKHFLTEEALAPLYFGVPIKAMRAADDNLLRQLGAP